jgi:thiosulfate dehydrogenase [quinone] large subunit
MSTLHHPPAIDVQIEEDVVTHATARRGLAALRIGFGVTFLWAFFDKLLALGFATGVNPETGAVDRFGPDAWINGGSPTFGFLTFGVPEDNPFREFFNGIAGDTWVNWLFMLALLGIGLALTSGVGMRIAAASGALLYLMMWVASMPLENNPVVDDHLLGAITVVVLALTLSGDTWGLGKAWARTGLVRRYEALR